ncbi:PLP-dependent transferase [Paraburkholderia silvatlantica]|uniref:PLP-dependent transferase n=1 Tax=Paraburkholderia silvatlantica TaxID=321895 RepID=UPI001060263B|nr:PLP-dependent transferase [Paraburkholderia silvatlantica]TDQ92295.1 cystathionine beta-lyase [Paraburkholderia silvatlantica]
MNEKSSMRTATRLVANNTLEIADGISLPVPQAIQATTVLFDSPSRMLPIARDSLDLTSTGRHAGFYYGGVGTPTTQALAASLSALEGGESCALFPSGQAAIHAATAVLAQPGTALLVSDSVTYTTRWLFDQVLTRQGVRVQYFHPLRLDVLTRMISAPGVAAVFMESPGSMFFEVQDVRAISGLCRSHGVASILDNTWAGSVLFDGFATGEVDVVVLSLSKYHGAPCGVSGGAIITREQDHHMKFRNFGALIGATLTSDAASRIAAGLPNLPLRMQRMADGADHILATILGHFGTIDILRPCAALCSPDSLWQRDFSGANSLMTLRLDGVCLPSMQAAIERFRVVRHGYGWGGDVSLVNLVQPNLWRDFPVGGRDDAYLRLYVGMEDPLDIADDVLRVLSSVLQPRA